MSYLYLIKFLTFFCFWTVCLTGSNFKDTTTLIQEWVQTEQLIGEESTDWNKEKAALIDIRDALNKEIVELDQRLAESEEEAVGRPSREPNFSNKKTKSRKPLSLYSKILNLSKPRCKNPTNYCPPHWPKDSNPF